MKNKLFKEDKEKVEKINENLNFSFSNEFEICNWKYKRFSIILNWFDIWHIQYWYSNWVLVIDMIKITNKKDRNKWYAYAMFNEVFNSLKESWLEIIKIKSSEDWFTDQWREFFKRIANKSWWDIISWEKWKLEILVKNIWL